ncbi:TIR domain-containing protein [Acidithiobacillus ferrianus]|uniref:TIR domain-containing protein n=1 Tax=Acidithiobacillus ferrianus TaxID=2678518 RepID=UPI0034E618B3
MKKAFLSHSSEDEEFVRQVASKLGRQYCLVDKQVFDNGITFKDSIDKHLDESSVFVLFASRKALESVWVEYEINESWYLKLKGSISSSIVFIIDSDISYKDLPPWLGRAKIARNNVPPFIAREIRQHINNQLPSVQRQYFEGRTGDMGKLETLLQPIDSTAPNMISIWGLPGIGKKTFIERSSELMISFNRILTVAISEGDSEYDIAIKVSSILEPYSTKKGFENIVNSIRSDCSGSVISRLIDNLSTAVQNKELPVFVDDGGLLDQDGLFTIGVRSIIQRIKDDNEAYLFISSTRKIKDYIPSLHLAPLKDDAVKRVISKLAHNLHLKFTLEQISELCEYIKGFPPSIYYSVNQASEYGIEVVLADKSALVTFGSTPFIRFLNSQVFTENQKQILATIARYNPIPLEVIANLYRYTPEDLVRDISALIDRSVVLVDGNGLYSISGPVTDAVYSEFCKNGRSIDDQKIYSLLRTLSSQENIEIPRLELYRLTFRAALRCGKQGDPDLFHMINDLFQIAEDYYHSRDYANCIKVAEYALKEDPKGYSARDYLIRSLVQEEHWDRAYEEIVKFQQYAPERDVEFLLGFLERKRGQNIEKALNHLLTAKEKGRKGASLSREIANCYYLLKNYSEAKKYLYDALEYQPDNQFIIDLLIQLAIREDDENLAREMVKKLKSAGGECFYLHRVSTIELKFGLTDVALEMAEKACTVSNERPTFSMFAHLGWCQIRTGKYDVAEQTIRNIMERYPTQKQDIRLGLMCRLEISRGKFARALELCKSIKNVNLPVYLLLKRDAIEGNLKHSAMPDETRESFRKELEELKKSLFGIDINAAMIDLISS